MGLPDSSLIDFIDRVWSWVHWGYSDMNFFSHEVDVMDNNFKMRCSCGVGILNFSVRYKCQCCGSLLCSKCGEGHGNLDVVAPNNQLMETREVLVDIKSCKLCSELGLVSESAKKFHDKVYPSESLRSPEPLSPALSDGKVDDYYPRALSRSSDESFPDHPSPVSGYGSAGRCDDDVEEAKTNFSTSSDYLHDSSDADVVCSGVGHVFCGFMPFGSSTADSPSRLHCNSNKVEHYQQQQHSETLGSQIHGPFDSPAVLGKLVKGISDIEKVDDLSIVQNKVDELPQRLNFETNSLIWLPPPPDDLSVENNFFTYDDEDDEVGDSGALFSSTTDLDCISLAKEKQHADLKDSLGAIVQEHFRVLVTHLLQTQGVLCKNNDEGWLNIITTVASQAADFIKPDTRQGGSMDPCDYVKVKCVASGRLSESKLIKGIVCTKNIKHKRMASQYRKTKLLLLGGALEYQRDPSQLASFETLLPQENKHLEMIVSKIVAHRPNVLLVEKSVSAAAQDLLLGKEISLVLNVKRPLLDRIARCSGATISPSADHLSNARLGHCEFFHLERITEEHEPANQLNKKPIKTLMYFEGCPRRLGCTVLLRGSSREELKKVKKVVQYAVFAAYNLSLEASFLADEGVTLPKIGANSSHHTAEKMTHDVATLIPDSVETMNFREVTTPLLNAGSVDLSLELGLQESMSELGEVDYDDTFMPDEVIYRNVLSKACDENLALNLTVDAMNHNCPSIKIQTPAGWSGDVSGLAVTLGADDTKMTVELSPVNGISQGILVSFSCHNILNGTVCERSQLIRLKFYAPSDKPLGRYLRDLFDKSTRCPSCKESAEAHSICYTHQHGNLMINVRHLPSVSLPGEQDGKIWMWHRCLRCTHVEGVPPATQRVVMSDAAWGLSFGKFLQLNFSTHATGNLVASCGHSLQKDCLWFYGFGSMVAFFRYSPINILSVRLPPLVLEFSRPGEESWIRKEASELLSKSEVLYEKLEAALQNIYDINCSLKHNFSDASDLHCHILELINILDREKKHYRDLLQFDGKENYEQEQAKVGILEINQLRHSLLTGSRDWDRRLYLLDSLLRRTSSLKAPNDAESFIGLEDCGTCLKDNDEHNRVQNPKSVECSNKAVQSSEANPIPEEDTQESHILPPECTRKELNGMCQCLENAANKVDAENLLSAASILPDQMDSSEYDPDHTTMKAKLIDMLHTDLSKAVSDGEQDENDNPSRRRLLSPTRVYSFDSLQRLQQRKRKVLRHVSHLSALPSFHASGDYSYMLRDPVSSAHWSTSQVSLHEAEKLQSASTSFIHSISLLPEGARLMAQQNSYDDICVTVYDDEPTSIISFALCTKEYFDWIGKKPNVPGGSNADRTSKGNPISSDRSTWDSVYNGSYGSRQVSTIVDSHSVDLKSSPHLKVSFEDESLTAFGKVKFFVTCYFGKQFDALRRRCCPCEVDFISSISRCKKWSAQGGKSNVFFAKSIDDRFIIKQVTKTELDSFCEFGPEYFEYLTNALNSGNPTCLAKILGIYQVTVRQLKGGKERKMDIMVMENLFFKKNVSKIYDLKGSTRSRYNSNTTGADKVLLDMNLLETLHTNPIFFRSESKRVLERAIWNDTSFLASADVMDYSLLVGVDEDRKELVVGIIDYMRQYTWDKHLETWVKASGILGGPKNASPTIISPKQYKKRFRKAMTTYFLTVPYHWS